MNLITDRTAADVERYLTLRNTILPSDDELSANPRARSAKLRIAEKL